MKCSVSLLGSEGRHDGWLQEKIVFAGDMLVSNAIAKIEDGDVILTYAASSIVFDILVKAHQVTFLFLAPSCQSLTLSSCMLPSGHSSLA